MLTNPLPRLKFLSLATVIAVGVIVSACVSAASPDVDPGDAELVLGRTTYVNNCVSCHGAAGDGGTGNQINGENMLELYPTQADQVDLIVSGRGRMPAFGARLSEAEIAAVVRYSREVLIPAATVAP